MNYWNNEMGRTIVAFVYRNQKLYYHGACKGIGEFIENLYAPEVVDDSLVVYDENGEPTNLDEALVEDTRPEAEWHTASGNGTGLTNDMVTSGIGIIDIDGQYDSVYTTYLEDVCDERQIQAMTADGALSRELLWLFINKGCDLPEDFIMDNFDTISNDDAQRLQEIATRPRQISEDLFGKVTLDYGDDNVFTCHVL